MEKLISLCGKFFSENEQNELFPVLISWAGDEAAAVKMFEEQTIPSCDNKTMLELCSSGRAELVMSYIEQIKLGGYQ